MATGSDDGEPGEQRNERPLHPEEWAVLAASPESESRIDAVEDSPAVARAVRDDSVLPIDSLDADDEVDPLTPEFRAPSTTKWRSGTWVVRGPASCGPLVSAKLHAHVRALSSPHRHTAGARDPGTEFKPENAL
jgi:hypothetical protein